MAGSAGLRAAALMGGRRRWGKLVQWILTGIFLLEMGFLLRVDLLNGTYLSESYFPLGYSNNSLTSNTSPRLPLSLPHDEDIRLAGQSESWESLVQDGNTILDSCEEWLEREDTIQYKRDFSKDPVVIVFGERNVWNDCAVGCVFNANMDKGTRAPDGLFGLRNERGAARVLRSMESASYYPENDLTTARKRGYDVVMTTSLASDVPVGYFSWAEYNLMAPVRQKTEKALAAAFISNCGAHNFRLEALEELRKESISIDSYGACLRNREGRNVDKVDALRKYKFSLAFENSNEDDYVTEKFWQSLVAGSVPVVVGAPNIQHFSPDSNAILHISSINDLKEVAQKMKYLASNNSAYNETLRWKFEGPSDSFKALVDMAAVHSSCRLCIHLATQIRFAEETRLNLSQNRPCRCKTESGSLVYHIYVRERGRFDTVSVFLRELTITGLHEAVQAKFKSLHHEPIWLLSRPSMIQINDLKIYRLYPVGLTQREALFSWNFHTDDDVKGFLEDNMCPKLEVIFV